MDMLLGWEGEKWRFPKGEDGGFGEIPLHAVLSSFVACPCLISSNQDFGMSGRPRLQATAGEPVEYINHITLLDPSTSKSE